MGKDGLIRLNWLAAVSSGYRSIPATGETGKIETQDYIVLYIILYSVDME